MKCVHTFGTGSHKRQADITLLFQYNLRSTSPGVTTTHLQTGTAILRNEERAHADNETDENPSILSSPMQTAHTMPDSGAVAITMLDAVCVLLMTLLTVSISLISFGQASSVSDVHVCKWVDQDSI